MWRSSIVANGAVLLFLLMPTALRAQGATADQNLVGTWRLATPISSGGVHCGVTAYPTDSISKSQDALILNADSTAANYCKRWKGSTEMGWGKLNDGMRWRVVQDKLVIGEAPHVWQFPFELKDKQLKLLGNPKGGLIAVGTYEKVDSLGS